MTILLRHYWNNMYVINLQNPKLTKIILNYPIHKFKLHPASIVPRHRYTPTFCCADLNVASINRQSLSLYTKTYIQSWTYFNSYLPPYNNTSRQDCRWYVLGDFIGIFHVFVQCAATNKYIGLFSSFCQFPNSWLYCLLCSRKKK